LADGDKQIKIFGDTYHRRAEVVTINGFSAHAGQKLLLDYAMATKETLKKVFLVHGEPRGAEPLMEKMRQAGIENVEYPELGDVYEI
jgi:metallo-beta-lactamase family protein